MQIPMMDRGSGLIVNMLFLALVRYAVGMGPAVAAAVGRLLRNVMIWHEYRFLRHDD
jgi:hypothetical protein|nr:hypothetical protein Q903MT_gene3262 [Picea sitchensis]